MRLPAVDRGALRLRRYHARRRHGPRRRAWRLRPQQLVTDYPPLIYWGNKAGDFSFLTAYATEDAFTNPASKLKAVDVTLLPAMAGDRETWRKTGAKNVVPAKHNPFLRNPGGTTAEKRVGCSGIERIPVLRSVQAVVDSAWPANHGFSHISARPRHPMQVQRTIDAFKKNWPATLSAHLAHLPKHKPIEVWFQDEARIGQKNGLVRQWARCGTRSRQPADQRYESAYLLGAICPTRGVGAALAMPFADTQAMQFHLNEIARTVRRGAHAVLLLDRAGW